MYIRSLSIRSLRSFESAKIDLQYPGRDRNSDLHAPNVNLLLGNNGTGKSSILRAIALSVLSPVIARSSGYVSYHMVRRGKMQATVDASVLLHRQDGARDGQRAKLGLVTLRVHDNEIVESKRAPASHLRNMLDDNSPAFLVVGYGATRRVEEAANFNAKDRRKRRMLRFERVAGLFDNDTTLTPLATWLPAMEKTNKGRYVQIVHLINALLPEARFTGEQERKGDGEYLFELNGVKVPFGALSDGYRAYVGWIADLLYHVCMGAPSGAKLVENRGIVLVDEIDLHLHPEWQRTVVPTVAAALPNLQFVFSTHSPIVAGSVQRENVFVMEPDDSGASVVEQFTERIYGLDAQQILLSPYFGLETTRAPGFVDEIESLAGQLAPGRSDVALSIMQKLAGKSPAPSPRKRK